MSTNEKTRTSDEYRRFENLTRRLVSVPKTDLAGPKKDKKVTKEKAKQKED